MTIIEKVIALRATNSKLEKEALLSRWSSDKIWKKFLYYTYNPYITYGITAPKVSNFEQYKDLDDKFFEMVEVLAACKDRELYESLENVYGSAINTILSGSINAGVDVLTINKVYTDLVPHFQVQKCKEFNASKAVWPAIAQIKYDGHNVTVAKRNGVVTYYTSSGKPFYLTSNGMFDKLPDNTVYLCEFIGRLNGLLSDRTNCGYITTYRTRSAKGYTNSGVPNYRLFDAIPLKAFEYGTCTMPYKDRLEWLLDTAEDVLHIAESKVVKSLKEWEDYLDEVTKLGYEGLVYKSMDMHWHADKKRRDTFMRGKKYPTFDLLCVGVKEGKRGSKYEGQIGSIIVKSKSGKIHQEVGSGLDDSVRLGSISIVGRVVEIKCERISADNKLIQPVLVGIRDDKTVEDIDL